MAVINDGSNLGLVIQKNHIRTKTDFAGALLIGHSDVSAGLDGQDLNTALGRIWASGSSEASSRLSGDTSMGVVVTANKSTSDSAELSLTGRVSTEEDSRSEAISNEASSRLSGDASVKVAYTAADTALSSGLSTVDSANLSSAYSADVVLQAALSTVDSAEASSRLSGDTSLDARLDTLEAGVEWDAGNRTLDIGDNVEFVFEDYSGFSAGDAVAMEIKYKNA